MTMFKYALQQLASGAAHMGVTGEDLVREQVADVEARMELLTPLGFGHANVVVAVPQAWIDVRSMADLDDVATAFRLRHDRKMRVATKYVNLTRGFFAQQGIVDYRIVESAGATEGYLRGISAPGRGPDPHTGELGMKPSGWISGPFSMGSETCFHPGYREWMRLLKKGVGAGSMPQG